jgi:hypothetical protein
MIKSFQKGSSGIDVIISLVMLCVILVGVFLFKSVGGWISCNNYQSLTDRQTKYSVINGCFVKTKSGWIPKSEIRSENVE